MSIITLLKKHIHITTNPTTRFYYGVILHPISGKWGEKQNREPVPTLLLALSLPAPIQFFYGVIKIQKINNWIYKKQKHKIYILKFSNPKNLSSDMHIHIITHSKPNFTIGSFYAPLWANGAKSKTENPFPLCCSLSPYPPQFNFFMGRWKSRK